MVLQACQRAKPYSPSNRPPGLCIESPQRKIQIGLDMKILLIAGARPNFMKIAPLIHELTSLQADKSSSRLSWKLVHTGQHYDYEMSKVFFDDFDIPEPDYFLNVGSGSHAKQTSKIMTEFEKICIADTPDIIIVVGDVNSTLA